MVGSNMRKMVGVVVTTALLVAAIPAAVAQETDGDAAVDLEQVLALHDSGLGWGAIARLEAVAGHLGIDAEELLAATPYVDGEPDFDFGSLLGELDKDGRAALQDQVKSYKDLIKDATKALRDEEVEGDDEDHSDGKAALLADAFDMDVTTVLALNAEGVGYGAIFKLAAIASVKDITVEELAATAPRDDDGGIAFGELKKSLTPAELDELAAGAKTFGQLVSSTKKAEKAIEKAEKNAAKAQKKVDKATEKAAKDEAKAAKQDEKDSDEQETDHQETDGIESDATESDEKESGATESDSTGSDPKESDEASAGDGGDAETPKSTEEQPDEQPGSGEAAGDV